MTTQYYKYSEQIVQDAVQSGLYSDDDDVIRDALDRLNQPFPQASNPPARDRVATRPAEPPSGPVTPEELNRRLLAAGLVLRLPDPAEDIDDANDLPVEVRGEPISETILRGRR